jgi:hypothetical protein
MGMVGVLIVLKWEDWNYRVSASLLKFNVWEELGEVLDGSLWV